MANHHVFELIHTISSAVTSPDGWSGALARLSDATRGSVVLIGTTPRSGGQFHLSAHGVDQSALGLINGPLATAEANPVFSTVSRLLRESGGGIQFKPVVLSSVVPEKVLLESSVFAEALGPSGVRHPMTVVLEASNERAISLTLGRGAAAGDFRTEEVELLAQVAPHLHCALT
ncbi:MAG TPA: hypothetical protein VGR19_07615, partial [Allosphingosinicella sp.]|nr:hypothetical protein [Allosphingosinicella sp.]